MVSVSFADAAAWRAVRARVLEGGLVVPATATPAVGTTVQVWLRLPSGVTLMMGAEVGSAPAGQLNLKLQLTPALIHSIEFG